MSPSTLRRPDFIESNRTPVWVVITGNVRSGKEFRRMFEQVTELRKTGCIDGIRFVTWKGELEQAPGLEEALVGAGVSILCVEPPIPAPGVHPLFHGYVYHQRKALHFALRSLPPDAFVLKARTDFAEERFDSMVATLFQQPTAELRVGISSPILDTRLFTYDARPDHLFYWDDIVFSGMRNDLLKFNNFDLTCDFIYPGHVSCAEIRLFSPLFLKHYPVLAWFFENVHGEGFARLLKLWLSTAEPPPLPALVNNILASYFHILSRYLILPKSDQPVGVPIHLGSFFTPDSDLGVIDFRSPWNSHKLVSQYLLDRLRSNEEFNDFNLAAVASLMRRMDSDVESRGALPVAMNEELAEFSRFAEHYGTAPIISQEQLISPVAEGPHVHGRFLEHVELPEKRRPSRWEQKKLGARKKLGNWILERLL